MGNEGGNGRNTSLPPELDLIDAGWDEEPRETTAQKSKSTLAPSTDGPFTEPPTIPRAGHGQRVATDEDHQRTETSFRPSRRVTAPPPVGADPVYSEAEATLFSNAGGHIPGDFEVSGVPNPNYPTLGHSPLSGQPVSGQPESSPTSSEPLAERPGSNRHPPSQRPSFPHYGQPSTTGLELAEFEEDSDVHDRPTEDVFDRPTLDVQAEDLGFAQRPAGPTGDELELELDRERELERQLPTVPPAKRVHGGSSGTISALPAMDPRRRSISTQTGRDGLHVDLGDRLTPTTGRPAGFSPSGRPPLGRPSPGAMSGAPAHGNVVLSERALVGRPPGSEGCHVGLATRSG